MVSNKFRSKAERKALLGLSSARRELLSPWNKPVRALTWMLLFVACGSGSEKQDLATASSELAASPDLPTALAGKIVSPANNNVAAATTGSAEVTDVGTMSYSVPIWTPDGVNGMSPSLSIQYNSHSGWGLFGPKWDLAGLSVITRCNKTLAHDGTPGPVDYRGDTFCLDGKRLLRTSGSPGSFGEFRTEANPFEKIEATQVNASGILTFQILQRDGRILHYGRTVASRLFGTPTVFPVRQPDSILQEAYYAYYLDKISDRFGNTILIQYKNQVTGFNTEVKELVPTLIQWGGTGDTAGQRSVQFNYRSTPDPNIYGVDKTHQRYVAGLGIRANELLSSIVVSGPNGTGGTMTLKEYRFGYNMDSPNVWPQSLSAIVECDGNNICKRPTNIEWEPEANTFTRINLGLTDVAMQNPPQRTCSAGTTGCVNGMLIPDPNVYRRILVSDVNHDGRDDIIYRTPVTFGPNTCIGWAARISNGTSFGTSVPINLEGSPDLNCTLPHTSTSANVPSTGDPVLGDLNRDGFPDILAYHNASSSSQYKAHFNASNPTVPIIFGGSIPYEAPHLYSAFGPGIAFNPQVSVSDINGDGWTDVVRPRLVAGGVAFGDMNGGIWTANVDPFEGAINMNVPSLPNIRIDGFAVVDVDGDGTAEIIRNYLDSATNRRVASATSPTMNGIIEAPNSGNVLQTGVPGTARWMLDWNGDGLQDAAYIDASDPTKLVAVVNIGKGFFQAAVTSMVQPQYDIGWGWRDNFESGVRVADYNGDGRDDLILVDNGATSAGPSRTTVAVLLSNGDGTFSRRATSIPIADFADGFRQSPPTVAPAAHGYRTSVVMDINGDDLPDFAQLEARRLVVYIHDGKRPNLVTKITEGTKRALNVVYAPLSDSSAYVKDAACPNNAQYFRCLVRGRVVVKSVTDSGDMVSNTRSFKYTNGVSDKGGRGFLGFKRIDIYGPGSRHIYKLFDPATFRRLDNGNAAIGPYMYPHAFRPTSISTHVDTEHGPNSHHETTETLTYTVTTFYPVTRGFSVMPSTVTTDVYDCPPLVGSDGSTTCGDRRMLGRRKTTNVFDSFGNLTSSVTEHYASPTQLIQTDSVATVYEPVDVDDPDALAHWMVSLPQQTTVTSSIPNQKVTARVTKFTSDRTVNSISRYQTGAPVTIETEPTGNATTRLLRTFGRDPRGRITTVTDKSVVTGEERKITRRYDDADGVYVSSVIDGMDNPYRIFRHPGFGLLVENADPNGAASTSTYDTFGRLLSTRAQDGQSVTFDYSVGDTQPLFMSGADITIYPEGKTTRAVTLHVDPYGNETSRVVPIDANRKLVTFNMLDARGRLVHKSLRSLSGTVYTDVNVEGSAYDDKDRLISRCTHASSDGAYRCVSHVYDGLTEIFSDENGRTTTKIHDAMGRISIERAELTNPAGEWYTSDATFVYGPFGLLEKENSGDGSGSTTMTYDVLGRSTLLQRAGVSLLVGRAYNAFGDVTSQYKIKKGTSTRLEEVTLGYDKAARLVSQTSSGAPPGTGVPPGLNRRFHYDKNADGTAAPNGKGRLNDVVDTNFRVSLHFDYDSSGRTTQKKWTVFNPAVNQNETWTVQFNAYDTQGRVDTMTYPRVPGETAAFAIKYAYDPYLGAPSSVTNTSGGGTIWSASTRSERGEVTREAMSFGSIAITRVTNYYLQDGRVKDATLSSNAFGNPQSKLAYTYQHDGLPNSFGMSGVGGSWSSTFDYDNLSRLTSWSPASGVNVTYRYDADGNMTSRSWSSSTGSANVTYATTTPDANGAYNRTISGSGTGVTTFNDTYKVDSSGRIWDTPIISIKSTEDDKIGSITEKSNGRLNTFIYDGQSKRVLTLFGTNGSAGTLLTLDGLFELKSVSSGTEGRCRISAGNILVGDVVRRGTAARTATFYLTDLVGSVVAEASQSGAVTARGRRDPFGNRITNATTPNLPADPTGTDPDGSSRLGFGTHNRDRSWGLVDMVNRGYSPRLGRFIYPDLILPNALDRRDHNPFAYVRNQPTASIDPDGLDVMQGLPPEARAAMERAQAEAVARAEAEARAMAERHQREADAQARAYAHHVSQGHHLDEYGRWRTADGAAAPPYYETVVRAPHPGSSNTTVGPGGASYDPGPGLSGPPPSGSVGLGDPYRGPDWHRNRNLCSEGCPADPPNEQGYTYDGRQWSKYPGDESKYRSGNDECAWDKDGKVQPWTTYNYFGLEPGTTQWWQNPFEQHVGHMLFDWLPHKMWGNDGAPPPPTMDRPVYVLPP